MIKWDIALQNILDEDGQSIFVKKEVDEDGNITYSESSITTFNFGGVDFGVEVNEDGTVSIDNESAPLLTFNGATGAFVSVGDDENGGKSIGLTISASADSDDGENNPFSTVNVDFSSITMFSTSGSSSLEAYKGSLTGVGAGKQVGNMTGVSVDASGKIYGKYDNGDSKLLGQISVATFANPAGLEAVGNSMFAATQNSGDFDGIGQDPTQGGGSLTTGVLEMSNVDLSQQFTDMITTQRGFQANSRIITTSDSLLEELINLKR
ncbi:MAG: hypothetical protein K0R00_1713 [Herbinix sp.]|nr:hypothetical protein [Herbinix sp.]